MSLRATSSAGKLRRAIDVTLHDWAMSKKHAAIATGIVFLAGLVLALTFAWALSGSDWGLFWRYNVARAETFFGLGHIGMLSMRGMYPFVIARDFSGTYHETFWVLLPVSLLLGYAVAIYAGLMSFVWLRRRGDVLAQSKHLRGARLATVPEVIAQVEASREGPGEYMINTMSPAADEPEEQVVEPVYAEAAKLATKTLAAAYGLARRKAEQADVKATLLRKKIYVPKGMAQRNFVYTGGMGSGKSQGMDNLFDQVLARGKCQVVYDKTTIATQVRYRKAKDVNMDPFDERFCENYGGGYSILNDIQRIEDFDAFGKYQLPENRKGGGDTSEYFNDLARIVYVEILRKCYTTGNRTNAAIVERIFNWSQEQLFGWLQGTGAASILNPDSAGTGGGGVLTTLQKATAALRYIPDGDFSIKQWLKEGMVEGKDQIMFIPSPQVVHQVLQPYNRFILSLVENIAMSFDEVSYDRLWIWLDEIYSLGKFPDLAEACTEGRKYGIVHVVGLQDFAQIQEMFGDKISRAILGNLQNQIILRTMDATTQDEMSKMLGSMEVDEVSEGLSFGAADSKDGHSVNIARQEKRAVLASEFGQLADMEGFLKLAGNYPVCRIKYEYVARPKVCEGYIPRADLDLSNLVMTPEATDEDRVPATIEHKPEQGQVVEQGAEPMQVALEAAMHATTIVDRELQDTPVERTPGKRRIGRIGMRNN